MSSPVTLAELIAPIVARWQARYPAQASRIAKAQGLLLAGHVSPWDAASWRVVSSGKTATYWVEVRSGFVSCTCPDHKARAKDGIRCAHAWACALSVKVAEALAPEPDPDPAPPTAPSSRRERASLGRRCQAIQRQNQQALAAYRREVCGTQA